MSERIELRDPTSDRAVECQSCEWTGEEREVDGIIDLVSRISPGEIVPVGECPKCGALCHYTGYEVLSA